MAVGSILVVEDEPIIRMDLADHLEAAGFEVTEAGSADRAIVIISQGMAFDVVVTDVQLPGAYDGVAFALWIKKHRPHMKMIIVSGATTNSEQLIPLGREGVIVSKPYSLEELTAKALRLLPAR